MFGGTGRCEAQVATRVRRPGRLLCLCVPLLLGVANTARAEPSPPAAYDGTSYLPPASEAGDRRWFRMGIHLGFGPALGNVDDGVSMTNRVGVAPTYLLEGFVRVTDRLSLGLLSGGVFSLRSGSCPAKDEGFSCGLTAIGLAAGMARYQLSPLGQWRPWVGAGPAFGVFMESASRALPASSGFCLVGCGGRQLDRSTFRYGPEGVIGVGAAFPLSSRVSFGGALHGIFGAYQAGVVREEISGGGASSEKSLSVHGGLHAIFLFTAHLQIGFGS